MVDKRCRWPSGKMLGGSSGLNYMLHVRGHPSDYDSWAAETGDTSWSYQEVKKYFNKAEKHDGSEKGGGGLLPVSDPSHASSLGDDILSMARDSGYKVEDVNTDTEDNNKTVFTVPRVNQEGGRRTSTYHSYLRGALHRPNLRVMRNSRVLNIITRDGRAVGVTYSRYGAEASVRCNLEVIVTAGTVNSAKLLLLSGVGPREELDRLGIKVVADLPVGQNLQVRNPEAAIQNYRNAR